MQLCCSLQRVLLAKASQCLCSYCKFLQNLLTTEYDILVCRYFRCGIVSSVILDTAHPWSHLESTCAFRACDCLTVPVRQCLSVILYLLVGNSGIFLHHSGVNIPATFYVHPQPIGVGNPTPWVSSLDAELMQHRAFTE